MGFVRDLAEEAVADTFIKIIDKIDERDKKKKTEKHGSLEEAKKAEKIKAKQDLIEYKRRDKERIIEKDKRRLGFFGYFFIL